MAGWRRLNRIAQSFALPLPPIGNLQCHLLQLHNKTKDPQVNVYSTLHRPVSLVSTPGFGLSGTRCVTWHRIFAFIGGGTIETTGI